MENIQSRPTCIIVEDDPTVRRMLQFLLARYEPESADYRSASEIADACGRVAPGIVFLDVALAGFDAVDVIRALADRKFSGSIQLISGLHSLLDSVKQIGERHGLTMLPPLAKPFRAGQIEQIIDTYLS